MHPPLRTPAPARSTSRDARFEAAPDSAPAAGTMGNRAAPPPAGSGRGRRGWKSSPLHLPFVLSEVEGRSFSSTLALTPFDCALRAPLRTNGNLSQSHLYAIALGSNRLHGRYGRPP